MKDLILFSIPAVIWGSTWLAIKFQVGEVDPVVSVSYRFFLAGLLLLVYSKWKGLSLQFNRKEHGFILLQGLLIFGINYALVYTAELTLTSGLVGLLFSTLVILNIINSRIFLKTAFEPKVLIGGVLGLVGMGLVFRQDLSTFSLADGKVVGLLFALGGAVVASLGNITSARNQKAGIPVIQSNALGMLYGAAAMLAFALISQKPITFEQSTGYILSLAFLSVFGSVIAFTAYLTLIGRIGASRSGYVVLVSPIIALMLSTLFEDYRWTITGALGAILILVGNGFVLQLRQKTSST
ncbi:MAG: EamA family transporter [Bacteroidota bacterium]